MIVRESNEEKLRDEGRKERDIFRKVVKSVAYGARVQDLFDELQVMAGLTNGNKW